MSYVVSEFFEDDGPWDGKFTCSCGTRLRVKFPAYTTIGQSYFQHCPNCATLLRFQPLPGFFTRFWKPNKEGLTPPPNALTVELKCFTKDGDMSDFGPDDVDAMLKSVRTK